MNDDLAMTNSQAAGAYMFLADMILNNSARDLPLE